MAKKRAYDRGESIKLPSALLNKVRKNKKKTGVSITAFICQAVDEKLAYQPPVFRTQEMPPIT